jgi:putative CocE/NonD family hydrolase
MDSGTLTLCCGDRPAGCSRRLAALLLAALPWSAFFATGSEAGEVSTPRRSIYLQGSDGVRLAVDVYLPAVAAERQVSAILVSTRYGRRLEQEIHVPGSFLERGYAFVIFDSRGSGASFGTRRVELSVEEIADIGAVSEWIGAQPWSDGKLALMGTSYSADAADLGTGTGAPSIKAAIVRFTESDPYLHLFYPGGVANGMMRRLWGMAVAEADRSVDCLAEVSACRSQPHLAPVDDDPDYAQLRAALRDHLANARLDVDLLGITFKDDAFPGRRETLSALGSLEQNDGINRHRVPVFYWGSWLDAGTALSALRRYDIAPAVPMQVFIGATSHAARHGADPFRDRQQPVVPDHARQRSMEHEFLENIFDRDLAPVRRIHYAVMGSDAWRSTDVWPPAGSTGVPFFLMADKELGRESSAQADTVEYRVDPDVTTGRNNRWRANIGAIPDYSDWPANPERLLEFRSAPLEVGYELVGEPRLELEISSSHEDGAVFGYLAVERQGRLSYVTEGMLRLVHRRTHETQAGRPLDVRSFARSDVLPMVPGESSRVVIPFMPTAVRLVPGDRLHLLLAGADAETFERYPVNGSPVWRVMTGGRNPSVLVVPMRPWERGLDTETSHSPRTYVVPRLQRNNSNLAGE